MDSKTFSIWRKDSGVIKCSVLPVIKKWLGLWIYRVTKLISVIVIQESSLIGNAHAILKLE
jgi:hypothetical protein